MERSFAVFALNAQTIIFEDDFESYDNFIIENVGDYTLVDLDGLPTYGFNGVTFDNSGYVGSFIVFNSTAIFALMSFVFADRMPCGCVFCVLRIGKKKAPIGILRLYFNIDFMNIADLLNKRCHPSLQGCMSPWDRLRKRDPRFPIEEKILAKNI